MLQDSNVYVEEVSFFIRWANHGFCILVKHHYICNSFFRETICKYNLLHLSSVNKIECIGEIYEQ